MKKIMNRLFVKLPALMLAMAFFAVSCTSSFTDINTNPYEPTEEDLEGDNFRIGAFFPQLQQQVIPIEKNAFQRAQNLHADLFSGYMAVINNFFNNNNPSTYVFVDEYLNAAYNNVYTRIFGAWMDIRRNTPEYEKSPNFALAQILKISALHRFTDNWGPMPYSQVGAGSMQVPYDSQQEVYELFFEELDQAIAVLTDFVGRNPDSKPLAAYDLVYGGDFVQWIKYANSLRLRLGMRVCYADETLAETNVRAALTHSLGVIGSNADNASIKTGAGITILNPVEIMWNEYSDIRMGASITSYMNGYADPRTAKYFQKSTLTGTNAEKYPYIGIRIGTLISSKNTYKVFSAPNIGSSDPVMWLNAAEVSFLRAEAALRGWDAGDAKTYYEQGVKLSFEQWDAGTADNYLKSTALPARYDNPVNTGSSINAVSTMTVAWSETANFEGKLEKIMTQKWLAMFPNGQEAWSEFRRTDYPKLFPVVKNNSGGKIDSGKQVRRLPFTPTEKENNTDNYNKAVESLGGPDTGATNVWWDKKPR